MVLPSCPFQAAWPRARPCTGPSRDKGYHTCSDAAGQRWLPTASRSALPRLTRGWKSPISTSIMVTARCEDAPALVPGRERWRPSGQSMTAGDLLLGEGVLSMTRAAAPLPEMTAPLGQAEAIRAVHQTTCCIVGGGPGGVMLALLLA